jgi:3-deoxy-manno-octulosonate cytidylyltransferase (CMP-KDO synthetase)
MSYRVLIPARLGSTRLPNKPLKDILGKTLLQRVVEQSKRSSAKSVHVATDSNEIIEHCNELNIQSILTSTEHKTGSDRLAESCNILELDDEEIIINVQGDEPFIDPQDINQLANLAISKKANMVTLFTDLNKKEFADKNVVKLWLGSDLRVEDFSRDINHLKPEEAKKHLGVYGYKVSFLRSFVQWNQTVNESQRNLEQMRAMDKGEKIYAIKSEGKYHLGVDTENDLQDAIKIAKSFNESN